MPQSPPIITNVHDVPLAIAVWALHDTYDYVNEPNYVSATKLLKPTRMLILGSRAESQESDVSDYLASALGTAIHDSVEKAWVEGFKKSLRRMGYDQGEIDSIAINPTDEFMEANPDRVPVYLEQRAKRKIDGFTIGGKYDFIFAGRLEDNKSTSAYVWLYGGREQDYILQGSIYKWLNPKKITADVIRINYVFTDWKKVDARSNPNYPQQRSAFRDYPLMQPDETEKWISRKLGEYVQNVDLPEEQIVECPEEELWLTPAQYKYYADPSKLSGRSTKNFDDLEEAENFRDSKGKGVVITIPGQAKRCGYCPGYELCTQKDRYST